MYRKILVPLDGSDTAHAGLLHAIALASAQGATLLLLHALAASDAGEPDSAKQRHRGALEILARGKREVVAAGLRCDTLLREFTGAGVPDVIEQQALQHHCDLVVMGTHARRGLAWLAEGSQAQELARSSRTPLLLVPPSAVSG